MSRIPKNHTSTENSAENAAAPSRRLGVESAQNRHALLDAAELIMREEGYAAVTSRAVASRAELKPQLVYYYFRTMDDLILAVCRRRTERGFENLKTMLAGPRPLHTLWQFLNDAKHSVLTAEFMAMANHRKEIGDEIARQAEQLRALQAELIERLMRERGIEVAPYPPIMLAMVITTLSQVLVREHELGISSGHAELKRSLEEFIDRLEPADK